MKKPIRLAHSFLLATSVAIPVLAAEPEAGSQSLEQAASDPTASLMSVQLQDVYVSDYYNLDDETGNTVLLRSAIPFTLGELKNIARISLPIITDSPSGESGIGDATVFDLVVFDRTWGRWGIGPVMLLPTATEAALGSDKWGIGPAIGFTARAEKMIWGVFNQNIFSFAGDDERADIGVSILQPIVNYSLPNKWSLGTSEMNISYDWERDDWSSLPLGIKVAKLTKLFGLPTQFSLAYEYNLADDVVVPKNTINLTAKFLFPL